MERITITEAAARKGVSRQAIAQAVTRGQLDIERFGPHATVVKVNQKFDAWQPVAIRQKAGIQAGKAHAKKAKKARRKKP